MTRAKIVAGAAALVVVSLAVPYFLGYSVPRRTCYGSCDRYPFSWWWPVLAAPEVAAFAAVAAVVTNPRGRIARRLLLAAALLTVLVAALVCSHPGAIRSLEPA